MNLPEFLTRNEDGAIRFTGHRIDLYHILVLYNEGLIEEQLHCEYPSLPFHVILHVIAFYHENKAELDNYVAAIDARIKRSRATAPAAPTLAELKVRRTALDSARSE